ncbi:MAG: error-prone DNA polymerase, partial [Alphaproteobacteria bacterium]
LTPMRPGRTVVEDYGSVGLSLRQHPLAFVRDDFARQGMIQCSDLDRLRDGTRIIVPGLVLMRQKPGSAKGVMFITLEDETGIANLIVWPSIFERQRRLILASSTMAAHGKVQKEGGIIHVIVEKLVDLSDLLRQVGERDMPVTLPTGRGDGARHGASPDVRKPIQKPRDIYCPERLSTGIKVQTRDFR